MNILFNCKAQFQLAISEDTWQDQLLGLLIQSLNQNTYDGLCFSVFEVCDIVVILFCICYGSVINEILKSCGWAIDTCVRGKFQNRDGQQTTLVTVYSVQ